ncbi:MAG: LysR family transcriptional regulator [Denitrobacterium detoxificans]|nr:LysR family transcriptional regulator [Denitrobacterium detoxificans]
MWRDGRPCLHCKGDYTVEDRSRYFILAYDSPNFSAAAAQVPMTPQGFTKIIRNLERDLGVPLFETDERGVRKPTRYADEYYQYAKYVQAAQHQLGTAFERISSESKLEIKVACALGIPGLFGVDALQRYESLNPSVKVSFSELPDALCDSLVRDGFFDVGITIQPAARGLTTVNLTSSPVMLWVRKDDPLSKRKRLTFEDLAGRKVAMPGKDFRIFEAFTRECIQRDVAVDVISYAEIFWIYNFALSGKGLGFCLPHLVALDVFTHSSDIVALPLEGITWQICFSWPEGRHLAAHENAYLKCLRKEASILKNTHATPACCEG